MPLTLTWRGFVLLIGLLGAASPSGAPSLDQPSAQGLEHFERKIRPVLIERCYTCHSTTGGKSEGGLLLDSADGWRKGGTNGMVIVPGDPIKSRLIQLLRKPHPDQGMPRVRPLSRSTVADFETWVRLGAPDPRTAEAPGQKIRQPATAQWAFQPPKRPQAPAVRNRAWVKDPLDAFLLARLEQSGLSPAPAASRERLIRRATFDLTGLAPTPAEIDAFLQDKAPDAFPKVVDRLLKSEQFGEQWGRWWLQLARYADIGTAELHPVRENAWRYRDYVIRAFNQDKPYDVFTQEQLAGDLLASDQEAVQQEQLLATGFLQVGCQLPMEPKRTKLLLDLADEQIDLTSRVFLGLSVSCARCHDHKSDPITMQDYYALAGIFTSTASLAEAADNWRRGTTRWREVSLATPEQLAKVSEYEERLEELKQQLREAREMKVAFPGDIDSTALSGVVVDNLAAELHGAWKESNYSTNFVDRNYLHDGDADKGKKSARFVADVTQDGVYEVLVSYTPRANRAKNVPITVTSKEGVKKVLLDQTQTPAVDKVFAPIGKFRFTADGSGSVLISNEGTKGFVVVDAVRFLPLEEAGQTAATEPGAPQTALLNYRQLEREFVEFRANRPVLEHAMAVQDGRIRDARLRLGGDPDKLGAEVPRGYLRVLGAPDSTLYVITDESSGRLELAHWLTHPEHALTARVIVNRIWARLFGHGLVEPVGVFGTMGSSPSHPDLLDHLARRFTEQGWSFKKMIRAMMLSSAYQMSSTPDPVGAEKDPQNRLWSRMNPRLLDAEVLRDVLLQLSRELERTSGGSWVSTHVVDLEPLLAARRVQAGSLRRSVYLPIVRERPAEILRALVSSEPSPAKERFLSERGWNWSEALRRAPVQTDAERIRLAYREAFTRWPSPEELGRAQEILASATSGGSPAASGWERLCQSLLQSSEFRIVP